MLNLPARPEEETTALLQCNEYTARFGLVLSPADAAMLCEARTQALQNTGRVEFGGGILPKLVYHFCDSPFIHPASYAQTLQSLQDIFYYFKNECLEQADDDELLELMKRCFDGECKGDLDYLAGSVLERYAHGCRFAELEEEEPKEETDDETEL